MEAAPAAAGLTALADTIKGARGTMKLVRRNLGFSLVYNACFAGLALAGLVSPLVAAVIMPLSSLTVLGTSVLGAVAWRELGRSSKR